MRKYLKKDLCKIIEQLTSVNETFIKKGVGLSQEQAQGVLTDCQQAAVEVGGKIEEAEGEGTDAVHLLEEYCEKVYLLCVSWNDAKIRDKELKNIRTLLNKVKNAILYDIPDSKKEVVFLPYKASMWDSLESVWMAADKDPDCDAYVIPIPYYDKNSDGSFKEMHYEGDLYPEYVPITHYEAYDFAIRKPDVIFIHNPYDGGNVVTSVHPFFYSYELKKYTDCLVYIPYYATTGSMNKSRGGCLAYQFADYIVIQAEGFRRFFDKNIPEDKFLVLGSPKFDRVIKMCNENPEIPKAWKEKISDKKVYFYNTSINGMLADTSAFLKKMKYVFECFEERSDACLLWRPHPLLESTFWSMRKELAPIYAKLKQYFILSGLGIYDDTSDVERAIALSDAYIGDIKSSVVSLFGVSGKPIFILNNNIDREPVESEFLGGVWNIPYNYGMPSWIITQCNQIYYAPKDDYCYKYFGSLSNDVAGSYSHCLMIGNKIYVCPIHVQDVPVIEDGIISKIVLEQTADANYSFSQIISDGKYLFLIPHRYPSIVRIHLESKKVDYFAIKSPLFVGEHKGMACVQKGKLYFASLTGPWVMIMDVETGKQTVESIGSESAGGANVIVANNDELWLLPCLDRTIRCWNLKSGDVTEFNNYPENFSCYNPLSSKYPGERPFNNVVFAGDFAFFSAQLANMCIRLNIKTGLMQEWIPPFEMPKKPLSGYYQDVKRCAFVQQVRETVWLFFSYYDASLYEVDLANGKYRQIVPEFDVEEVMEHEMGFGAQSVFVPYACKENAFNTLERFLSSAIIGNAYSKEKQLELYSKIAVNANGTCGEVIYKTISEFVKE